jgi:hypothetical protein
MNTKEPGTNGQEDRKLPWFVRVCIALGPILPYLAFALCPLVHPAYYRYTNLDRWAWAAWVRNDYLLAKRLATELLELSERLPRDWNYGNAVSSGHQILGLCALREDDIDAAKIHLLASGDAPHSPQLRAYGLDLWLARELAQAGEHLLVEQYLTKIESIVAPTSGYQRPYYEQRRRRINKWKKQLRQGRVPYRFCWEP